MGALIEYLGIGTRKIVPPKEHADGQAGTGNRKARRAATRTSNHNHPKPSSKQVRKMKRQKIQASRRGNR